MDLESFVLFASTATLADEPVARGTADALEFRFDLGSDPLDQLDAYGGELALLVTNRLRTEGGQAPDDERRLDALEAAVTYPSVEAVDVELTAVRSGEADGVLAAARQHDVAIIVSTHDFDRTPDRNAMATRLRAAAEAGAVGKLAVTAEGPADVLDLLAVTWSLSQAGVPVATMAMGEPGRHSRAVAPVYGSRLGYAPVSADEATAPGQYDLETLRTLVDGLLSRTP